MTRRSRAREVALQLLFQRDHNQTVPRDAVEQFARDRLQSDELVGFCLGLLDGAVGGLAEIDSIIGAAAKNWRVARMNPVDRNVLRLGVQELRQPGDTPPSVILNEAIELARRYGGAGSPAFVNGVLDRIHRDQTPPPAPEIPAST